MYHSKVLSTLLGSAASRSLSQLAPVPSILPNLKVKESSRLAELRSRTEILPFSAFLTDTFGRQHNYLRISVTERCNLRCTYCMPEEGVPLTPSQKLLSSAEIVRVAKIFVSQGVDKIRITGGEPLLRADLPSIISQLSDMKLKSIGITTNGILLARLMPELIASGVTAINVSLDTMNPKKFEKISRRPSTAWFKVWKGIEMADLMGYDPLKINCVVQGGVNDDEVCDFVELTKERNLDVRFIEYMPFSGNKWDHARMVPYQKMVADIQSKFPLFKKLEDPINHTAKAYKVPGHRGQVGFITSMSDHFCGGCNRLRVTADGNLKVCLFGNAELSLRDAIRSGANDEELLNLIGQGVQRKHAKHAGMMNLSKMENRPMILIGPTNVLNTELEKKPKPCEPKLSYQSNNTMYMSRRQMKTTHLAYRHFSTSNPARDDFEDKDRLTPLQLSHVDSKGKVQMVDVSTKKVTTREAIATAVVLLTPTTFQAVVENKLKKGDVLTIAQIAGIMGAKYTSTLIPLCHPLGLSKVDVKLTLDADIQGIRIKTLAKTTANTGVEMEALTAASIAALTIYDMCKAIDKNIVIKDIRLTKKTGGKSDYLYEA